MTVYEKMLKSQLISQAEFNVYEAKSTKNKAVKEKYNKATDKERFSKAELRSIIEDLL